MNKWKWKNLALAGLLAFFLAFFGAYMVVASQNPSAGAGPPQFEYGSPSPGPG